VTVMKQGRCCLEGEGEALVDVLENRTLINPSLALEDSAATGAHHKSAYNFEICCLREKEEGKRKRSYSRSRSCSRSLECLLVCIRHWDPMQ
jgi:hypothetical protein